MCFYSDQEWVNTIHVWGNAKTRLERNSREIKRVSELDWASSWLVSLTQRAVMGDVSCARCGVHRPVGCLTDTSVERASGYTWQDKPTSVRLLWASCKYDSKTSWGFGQPELLLTVSAACLIMAEEIEAVLTMHPSIQLNNKEAYT